MDTKKQKKLLPEMNCLLCNKKLTEEQVKDVLRGKMKGYCSRECSAKAQEKKLTKNCIVCNSEFTGGYKYTYNKKVCSTKCAGVLTSKRMIKKNPMHNPDTRKKVSYSLKMISHKPIIQGGNGRGATLHQLNLYNELIKFDNSFEMELIEKTGKLMDKFNAPTHYKIDIASRIHKIAIEVDGPGHQSKKVQECDKRKEELLSLKGWRVLRLLNSQIDKELKNCVQMVLSMI